MSADVGGSPINSKHNKLREGALCCVIGLRLMGWMSADIAVAPIVIGHSQGDCRRTSLRRVRLQCRLIEVCKGEGRGIDKCKRLVVKCEDIVQGQPKV